MVTQSLDPDFSRGSFKQLTVHSSIREPIMKHAKNNPQTASGYIGLSRDSFGSTRITFQSLHKAEAHCTVQAAGNRSQSGVVPFDIESESFSLCNPQKTSSQHFKAHFTQPKHAASLWIKFIRWLTRRPHFMPLSFMRRTISAPGCNESATWSMAIVWDDLRPGWGSPTPIRRHAFAQSPLHQVDAIQGCPARQFDRRSLHQGTTGTSGRTQSCCHSRALKIYPCWQSSGMQSPKPTPIAVPSKVEI